jgi:hypothetical protein
MVRAMETPWQPNFGFYLSRLGEDPASFVVDLNARPLTSHPLRLQLRVPLRQPRPDGLRDKSELEPMGDLEDRLVDALRARLGAVYVGRLVARGATEFFFYAPEVARPKLNDLEALVGDTAPYSVEYLAETDSAWQVYTQFLYPDPYSFQAIANRSLLEQLEQAGDVMTVARLVDHLAYFDGEAQAKEASVRLTAAGFLADAVKRRDDGRFGLEFHREDALADGQADAFVAEVLDIILPLDGDYDGWGCPVVKG